MSVYTIKDLEILTGVKAHTLRVWEQRYAFIKPKRSQGNIRFYDDSDLKVLLHISDLTRKGYRISRLACMEPCEVFKLAEVYGATEPENTTVHEALKLCARELNENKFNCIWQSNVRTLGFDRFVGGTILPFIACLQRCRNNQCLNTIQSNFIEHLIQRKLVAAIDQLDKPPFVAEPTFLLFRPENEDCSFLLLFAQYLLRRNGYSCLYINQQCTVEEAIELYTSLPNALLITAFNIFSCNEGNDAIQYLKRLTEKIPNSTIISLDLPEEWVAQLPNDRILPYIPVNNLYCCCN